MKEVEQMFDYLSDLGVDGFHLLGLRLRQVFSMLLYLLQSPSRPF